MERTVLTFCYPGRQWQRRVECGGGVIFYPKIFFSEICRQLNLAVFVQLGGIFLKVTKRGNNVSKALEAQGTGRCPVEISRAPSD